MKAVLEAGGSSLDNIVKVAKNLSLFPFNDNLMEQY